MTSLKPLDEVTGGNMFALPHHLTFEPWIKAWGEARIGVSETAGIMFPNVIDIQRPIEELSFRLVITKLRVNEPIQDEQFVLRQPPGSKLVNLDERTARALTHGGQNGVKDPQ